MKDISEDLIKYAPEHFPDAGDQELSTEWYVAQMLKYIAQQTGVGDIFSSMVFCFLSAAAEDIHRNPVWVEYVDSENVFSLATAMFLSLASLQQCDLPPMDASRDSWAPDGFRYDGYDDAEVIKVKTAHYYSFMLYYLAKERGTRLFDIFDISLVANGDVLQVLQADFRGHSLPRWIAGEFATYSGALYKYNDSTGLHHALSRRINTIMQAFISRLVQSGVCSALAEIYANMAGLAGPDAADNHNARQQLSRVASLFGQLDLTKTPEASQAAKKPYIKGFFLNQSKDQSKDFSGLCIEWITPDNRANTVWMFKSGVDGISIIHHPHGDTVLYKDKGEFTNSAFLQRYHSSEVGPHAPAYKLDSLKERGFTICCAVFFMMGDDRNKFDVAMTKVDAGVGYLSATPFISAGKFLDESKNGDGPSGSAPDE